MIAVLAQAIVAVTLVTPPVTRVDELPKLLTEEYDLLETLDQLDSDRRTQEKLLLENEDQRKAINGRLNMAALRHKTARQALKREQERVTRRIRVYLDLNRARNWQMLASAGDYATYLRKRRLVSRLIADDTDRIKRYHKTVARHRQAKTTMEAELSALEDVEKRIVDGRAKLERAKAVKTALLDSVRTEKAFYSKAQQNKNKAARTLQQKISRFELWTKQKSWFRLRKGQFSLPLAGGRIDTSVRFGKKKHPRFGTITMNRGLEFVRGTSKYRRHPTPRSVQAIYTGKVVYADWLKGYGNTVIIDHNERDYTMYAHLSEMRVKKGNFVGKYQRIGTLGATGSLRGERLYFEIRVEGKPVNPIPWFRKALRPSR